jgi:hypothetical protein
MKGQYQAPAALFPGNNWGTHLIGSWVGLRGGMDFSDKRKPLASSGNQILDLPARSLVTIRTIYNIIQYNTIQYNIISRN